MTRIQWVLRSLTYYRRIHGAVALGVAAATAVLTGALLVGDSVRGSLHALTFERLGKIEAVLASDRFFRHELVAELSGSPDFQQQYPTAAAGILFPQATIERRSDTYTARASAVLILGCDDGFWSLDLAGVRPANLPADGEVILNEALANELHAAVGDFVTLRLPKSDQVPADSPLANKNDRIRSLPNLKVVALIPAKGLGRFNLQASQALPRNAFVSLGTLQNALDQPGKLNAIFVGGPAANRNADASRLSGLLRPTLPDFGVTVKQVSLPYRKGDATLSAFDYFTVTTDRMIFDERMASTISRVVAPLGGQPVLTYLANSIATNANASGIPYSMVTAIDFGNGFRLIGVDGQPIGPLADDEIVLNAWSAADLQAKPGEQIRVRFFEPETTHGEAVERTVDFRLRAIASLTKPTRPYQPNRPAIFDQEPTAANDPDLTPEVKGVTDQATIDDWDAPFPFDYKRVRKVDEEYWDDYRTTPKAFVSAAAGRKLWGSRFGRVTSFRVPAVAVASIDTLRLQLTDALARDAAELGFQFIPIKRQQLAAASGTTPFDVLFLSLSFFVIAAALLMVSLLFRLGIEQRATELGTLLAVGFTRQSLGRLFMTEGACIAAGGAVIGLAVGIGYAWLMLAGLSSWWLGAISVPFLEFHWSVRSLLLGYGLGVMSAVGAIAWTVRQTRHISARQLLAGRASESPWTAASQSAPRTSRGLRPRPWSQRIQRIPLVIPLGASILLSAVASTLGGMAQAGAFVGAGAALLVVLLLSVRRRLLREDGSPRMAWERRWMSWGLAERNAARNPGRSVITVGLMATATFLIVAMSSFRLAPTEQGVGGFQFIAQSSEPIYENLNDASGREAIFGSRSTVLAGSTILGLRLRAGDDASCQNLYQSFQPRILGVTPQVVAHFDNPQAISFTWAGSEAIARSPEWRTNPWRLLSGEPAADDVPVPVVLDKNTALYSLHLYRGIGEEFAFDYDGRPIRFRVVGLLENSVLQGSLLIREADFLRRFPQQSGFRFFLIAAPAAQSAAVTAALEDRFSDQGLDVVPAHEILEQLLAVQNSYLSTFQSLGALGLLLGSFGLATVQLRNVLERRGELALLRAVGYRRRRLAELVLLENIVLLATGLLTGVAAALLAVLPHKFVGESAISWLLLRDLALMLLAVFLAGLTSSLISVRAVLRLPLLAALRGE